MATGRKTRKLLTDQGMMYVILDATTDQFVSPAFESPETLALYATTVNTTVFAGATMRYEEWVQLARDVEHVYDVRRTIIHDCVRLLAELKSGRSLNEAEACLVYGFENFLATAIRWSQRDYPELNPSVMQAWIDELRLRDQYREGSDWEDILDHCKNVVYYNAWSKRNMRHCRNSEVPSPTVEENKLIGRYISRMALIAKIAGTDKQTPQQIIEYFAQEATDGKLWTTQRRC